MTRRRHIINLLALTWLVCAYRLAHAVTFSQEVMGWDYQSVFIAAIAGLFGGAARTIYVLASADVAVIRLLMQARKDLVVSFMAGGAAYLLMLVIESKWPGTITPEVRYVGVLVAGWTRGGIFDQLGRLIRARVDGEAHKYRNGAPDSTPPTSANVPLEKNP